MTICKGLFWTIYRITKSYLSTESIFICNLYLSFSRYEIYFHEGKLNCLEPETPCLSSLEPFRNFWLSQKTERHFGEKWAPLLHSPASFPFLHSLQKFQLLVVCSSCITAFTQFLSFLLLLLPYLWIHITDLASSFPSFSKKQLILDSSSLRNLLPYILYFLGPIIYFFTRVPALQFILCPLVPFLCLPNPSQPEFVFQSQPLPKSLSILISSATTLLIILFQMWSKAY